MGNPHPKHTQRHKYICGMLVTAAVKEPSHQWKTVPEKKEHPPHQSCSFYELAAFRLDVINRSCFQFMKRLRRHKLLASACKKCFLFPKSSTHLGLPHECQRYEHSLISSEWENTHCFSFDTHSANCRMRHEMSCPIRKQCRRHCTFTLLFHSAEWRCLQA